MTGGTIPGMTPKVLVPHWKCLRCGHTWPIANAKIEPKQCPNRTCRAMDWNRAKIKEGRPRKDAKRGAAKRITKKGK